MLPSWAGLIQISSGIQARVPFPQKRSELRLLRLKTGHFDLFYSLESMHCYEGSLQRYTNYGKQMRSFLAYNRQ